VPGHRIQETAQRVITHDGMAPNRSGDAAGQAFKPSTLGLASQSLTDRPSIADETTFGDGWQRGSGPVTGPARCPNEARPAVARCAPGTRCALRRWVTRWPPTRGSRSTRRQG
jgi:hypothetical protein